MICEAIFGSILFTPCLNVNKVSRTPEDAARFVSEFTFYTLI